VLKCNCELDSIDNLPKELDLVIISTNADIRAKLAGELISKKSVKNIIFEKVLFQLPEDYYFVKKMLNDTGVNAWVNCPRRTFKIYQDIKEFFDSKPVNLYLQGGNWGMGCNSIHFLDTMAYINGSCNLLSVNTDFLDNEILESKRKGYIEFTGKTISTWENGAEQTLQSDLTSSLPPHIVFFNNTKRVVVHEHLKKAMFYSAESNWDPVEKSFEFPFQSQLTNLFAEDVLNHGHCELISFDESVKLHIKMIDAFIAHASKITKKALNSCSIT